MVDKSAQNNAENAAAEKAVADIKGIIRCEGCCRNASKARIADEKAAADLAAANKRAEKMAGEKSKRVMSGYCRNWVYPNDKGYD
jgi:hypothetical protein